MESSSSERSGWSVFPGREPLPENLARDWEQRGVRSRLAAARRRRGISQEEMAHLVGLSVATYRRLENKGMDNPPLLYLVNCALVLEVQLSAIVEDEWCTWTRLRARAPGGPPEQIGPRRVVDPPGEPPP